MAIKGSLETIKGASDDEKAKKKFMKIMTDQSNNGKLMIFNTHKIE